MPSNITCRQIRMRPHTFYCDRPISEDHVCMFSYCPAATMYLNTLPTPLPERSSGGQEAVAS